ncbi:MAG TPA: DUF3307 domain-containing protein [Rhodocyclaceae bacterium]|nr:DUF3307 domain-containing protein [Rhodocyclaceae bacterium]
MTEFLSALVLLLFAHALADYPLQGDFLAKAKNGYTPVPGVPWWQAMAAHSMIHAGFVFLVTQLLVLAVIEFVLHFAIDHAKCRGHITYNQDQAAHVACKVGYAVLVALLA